MAFASCFLAFLLLCVPLARGEVVSESEDMPTFVETGGLSVSAPIEILESRYVYGANQNPLQTVIRFKVPACSLHTRAMKYFFVSKVIASFNDETKASYFGRLLTTSSSAEVCLHRNESVKMGSCIGAWIPLKNTVALTFLVYHSEVTYVDIKIPLNGGLSDAKLQLQLTEEFCIYRVYLFMFGIFLFLTAPILSQWLLFYYSSGMLFGVAFIAFILPYKAFRQAPTIGQGLWYILFLGSFTGIGYIGQLYFLFQALDAMQSSSGHGEAATSILILSIVMFLLIGAGLGYWTTRSIILTPEGAITPSIAEFVKWAMRIVAIALLSQSSHDLEDSTFAVLLVAIASQLLHVQLWRLAKQRSTCEQNSFDPTIDGDYGKDFIPMHIQEQAFVSTFHASKRRRFRSPQEAASISQACTQAALGDLVRSPEFKKWAQGNQTTSFCSYYR